MIPQQQLRSQQIALTSSSILPQSSPQYKAQQQQQQSVLNNYLQQKSQVSTVQAVILKRMGAIKTIIDSIENQQQKESNIHDIAWFAKKFQTQLKFILSQLQTMQKVCKLIQKQNYHKYDPMKNVLIKTIRVQIGRFHGLIPQQVQDKMQESRLRGVTSKLRKQAHSQQVLHRDSSYTDKQQQNTAKDAHNIQQKHKKEIKYTQHSPIRPSTTQLLPSTVVQLTPSPSTMSASQNQTLLYDLRQFLMNQCQCDDSNTKTIMQQSMTDMITPNPDQNVQQQLVIYQHQHQHQHEYQQDIRRQQIDWQQHAALQQQKKKYKQFIAKQKIKQDTKTVKIAKRVALALGLLLVIVAVLICYFVYKMVKLLVGQL